MNDPHIRHLLDLIKEQNETIKVLAADRDALRVELSTFVAWAGSDLDALTYLQRTYSNPNESTANRTKSAGLALRVEHPINSMVIEENWMEKTRRIRLETQAKNRARWALEDQSKVIEGTLAPEGDEPAA
jgi:hypothetical protein